MKQEDLEKTQYMNPQDVQRLSEGERKFDTQPLPRVTEAGGEIQQPFPRQDDEPGFRRVRELPPEKMPSRQEGRQEQKKGGWLSAGKKRGLLLAVGFAAALIVGFMIAGYTQDQSAERQNQQKLEQQQLKDRQQKLAGQEADLKAQREALERQKQELQARERELEAKSSRAQGRNEQLEDSAPASALGKLVDKVTGKEAQREQQVKENKAISSQADGEVARLKQSIADAQSMLDDVDAKLDTVAEMQQEASRIKAKAESAYAENKDVIDKAVYYAKSGAELLSNWFKQ